MKNILVLTDFSKLADRTFEKAVDFANTTNAKIHVLNVVNVAPSVLFDKEGNLLESNDCDVSIIKKQLQDANSNLKIWTANKNRNITYEAKLGNQIDESLRYIKNNNIDEVFIGESRSSQWNRIFGGSFTKNLIKRSPVPVITVQKEADKVKENLMFQNVNPIPVSLSRQVFPRT